METVGVLLVVSAAINLYFAIKPPPNGEGGSGGG